MSEAGAVIEDIPVEGPEARRARREAPERTMSEAPTISVETAVPSGPSPEDALKDAQKAIEERDQKLAEANRREAAARSDAAQARDDAARARQGGAVARTQSLKTEHERAKADKEAAKLAIKTARDAGDLDAEIKAQESFNSADFRMNSTKQQLDQLNAGGEMRMEEPETRSQGGGGQRVQISAPAQDWISRHPRFNTDPAYREKLLAADNQAKLDGIIADSPAYFRALDAAHDAFVRAEGGNNGGDGGHEMNNRNNGGSRRQESSEATPPSRQQGGHGGASRQVKTALGTVSVTRRQDGKIAIQIPPAIRADFEEGARITNMDLGSYAFEQVKIADEVAAGGTGGLIREEGSIWK